MQRAARRCTSCARERQEAADEARCGNRLAAQLTALIEDVKSGDRHSTVAFVGTCVLLLAAPFERLQPIVSLPGQKLTTVEAAIVLALGAWVVALLCFRERPRVASAITAPWLLWLAVGVVAALAAPAFHLNALKVVARQAIGL